MVGVGLIVVNFVKCIIDIILNRVAWCVRFFYRLRVLKMPCGVCRCLYFRFSKRRRSGCCVGLLIWFALNI